MARGWIYTYQRLTGSGAMVIGQILVVGTAAARGEVWQASCSAAHKFALLFVFGFVGHPLTTGSARTTKYYM